jgi:RNA polymerase primary sigma factor
METYLQALRSDTRPLLTREEEVVLGRRIQAGDDAAHGEMVERNLRLAVSVAKKHRNRGLDFEELVQAASLGVMRAARLFDPERGYKFSSYCTWWCRAEIGRALQNTSRTVRLSAPVHADLQRIRAAERLLLTRSSNDVTPVDIAFELGDITAERVAEVQAYGRPALSLNHEQARGRVGYSGDVELGDLLPDGGPGPEEQVADTLRDEALDRALRDLPYRWRRIIVLRHGLAGEREHTLDECAAVFHIQREQVRIIQRRAEEALAAALSGAA